MGLNTPEANEHMKRKNAVPHIARNCDCTNIA